MVALGSRLRASNAHAMATLALSVPDGAASVASGQATLPKQHPW